MVEPQYANEYRPNAIFEPSPTANLVQAEQGYDNVWREKNVRFSTPDQWYNDAPKGFLVAPWTGNNGHPADTQNYQQSRRYSPQEDYSQD